MYEIYFINNIYCHPWVLVKIPRDQTHRAAQRVPGWWIEGLVSRARIPILYPSTLLNATVFILIDRVRGRPFNF
jgi:hypothetical protein